YLWYVNGSPYVWDRCRDPRLRDAAAEPYGRIRADPVIFLEPLTCTLPEQVGEATLPMWFDTSLWFREAHAVRSLAMQWRAVRNNLRYVAGYAGDSAPLALPALVIAGV